MCPLRIYILIILVNKSCYFTKAFKDSNNTKNMIDLNPASILTNEILNQANAYGANELNYSRSDAEQVIKKFTNVVPALTTIENYWVKIVDSGEAVWKYAVGNLTLLIIGSATIAVIVGAVIIWIIIYICSCSKNNTIFLVDSKKHFCQYDRIQMESEKSTVLKKTDS